MLSTREWMRTRSVGFACSVAVPAGFGLLSLALGQDTNWDLRNYHWYNAYSFLTGRFDFDVAPAQTATFYNPLLDVPLFLLAQHAPARVCGFVLGVLHGLNFVLLYALAQALLPRWAPWGRGAGGAIVAAIGVAGGGSLGLVGATFYDNVVSLLVLAALLVVVRSPAGDSTHRPFKAFVWAGLLAGAAAGLKLPSAIYAVGLAVACVGWPGSTRERLQRVAWFGAAGLAGVLVFDGFWMARLWSTFGNPVFPYFNDVFGSNMALAESYRDARFIPPSLGDAVAFPFVFSLNAYRVGEIEFNDLRIVVLYVIGIATVGIHCVRRLLGRDAAQWSPASVFALTTTAVSYAVWLVLFAIYRYVITLEMLAPLLVAALVSTWPVSGRVRVSTLATLGVLLLATTRPGNWGRTAWGERFVDAATPATMATTMPTTMVSTVDHGSPMVVMAGYAPLSWVIPAFTRRVPHAMPFVRLQGYSHHPDDGDIGLARAAKARVSNHEGVFYLLYDVSERNLVSEIVGRYGLVADFDACEPLRGNLDAALRICPVQRPLQPRDAR